MRNNIGEKTFNITIFLLIKGLVILIAFIVFFATAGCDKPYYPWNAGPSWRSTGSEEMTTATRETLPQREAENFCEDNRETVENYRRFLEPDYNWGVSPEAEERRRRYTQQFVDQYDNRCN